jgi:hypothetical protein
MRLVVGAVAALLSSYAMAISEFANFIKSEIAKWAPIVKAAGAKPD